MMAIIHGLRGRKERTSATLVGGIRPRLRPENAVNTLRPVFVPQRREEGPFGWVADTCDSRKLAEKVPNLTHLRDACPSLREYDIIVTWPRDRRVRA